MWSFLGTVIILVNFATKKLKGNLAKDLNSRMND